MVAAIFCLSQLRFLFTISRWKICKEYGKFTAEQFKALIDTLPELRREGVNFREAIAAVPAARFDELLTKDYNWAAAYELTFHEHLALVIYGLNMGSRLKAFLTAPDPQQKMLDDMLIDDLPDDHALNVEKQHAIGLVFSLQRTILSIMLYQRSMSSLILEVREQGSSEALFKAIRVDRAVLAAPSVADRIARAELRKDEAFFRHLRSALKGPLKKHWEAYCDLRYALFALRELGFDKLSDDQLERLMVHTLKVYPNTPSARKNLRAQYQQSRKIRTI